MMLNGLILNKETLVDFKEDTDISIIKGRTEAGENYVKISEEKREFSYDADENGYISKIYTGKEENSNKELLYTITYVNTKDTEK